LSHTLSQCLFLTCHCWLTTNATSFIVTTTPTTAEKKHEPQSDTMNAALLCECFQVGLDALFQDAEAWHVVWASCTMALRYSIHVLRLLRVKHLRHGLGNLVAVLWQNMLLLPACKISRIAGFDLSCALWQTGAQCAFKWQTTVHKRHGYCSASLQPRKPCLQPRRSCRKVKLGPTCLPACLCMLLWASGLRPL
jgi:hypothetical protein